VSGHLHVSAVLQLGRELPVSWVGLRADMEISLSPAGKETAVELGYNVMKGTEYFVSL
jgi:hypothetical protein